MIAVDHGIRLVFKLLGHEYLWIFFCHAVCGADTFFDTVADIPGVVYQYHSGPVMFYEETPLLTDGIGHDDHGLISLNGSDQCKTDSLVSACGFYDNGILL